MQMHMTLKNETKTCYRFEHREDSELTTLYLKKANVDAAGIDPKKGICVTIKEDIEHA